MHLVRMRIYYNAGAHNSILEENNPPNRRSFYVYHISLSNHSILIKRQERPAHHFSRILSHFV